MQTVKHIWEIAAKNIVITMAIRQYFLLGSIAAIARVARQSSVVCLCVCLSVGYVREHRKKAKPIEMRYGWLTRVAPGNHVLNGVESKFPKKGKGQFWGCPAHRKVSWVTAVVNAAKQISSLSASTRLLQPTALLLTGLCHITIRYDTVYLRVLRSLREGQLNLAYGTKKRKNKEKLENKNWVGFPPAPMRSGLSLHFQPPASNVNNAAHDRWTFYVLNYV